MNDTNDKIKFAIAGYGHIGKRHAAIISTNPDASLIAICDNNPKQLPEKENKGACFFNSLDSLLESGIEFDVLSIATPSGLHEEQAIKGLQTGHHVVIEKPMALTKAGCERIIYESLRQHKQVFCVMQNRYSPPSVWLKEIIQKNLLGEIYMVQINCYWNRDDRYYIPGNWHGTKKLDGGTLYTQFSHFIDIMFWLFGDIKNIGGKFTNFNHQKTTEFEDSGFIHFDFVNGGMGSFNFSTSIWNQNLESSMTIIAENGTVKVGGQYMNEVQTSSIKDYIMPELMPVNPPNDYGPYKGSAANHHFIFENVVNVLKGREAITTNALEGLKVVEIIGKNLSIRIPLIMPYELIIEAGASEKNYWKDLWRYRELFYILSWRDLKVRYKQTVIGAVWSILRPILTTIIFTFIFSRVAKLPASGSAPYALMVFVGMLPWQFFANSLSEASTSLVGNSNLITKVYFPRMIIPASSVITSLVDLGISLVILVAMFIIYHFVPVITIVFLPFFILIAFIAAFGVGLYVTALNVKYRDFRYIIPFIIQFGLYITPVGFSSSVIPEKWRLVYALNPMVGVVDGFRWCILGDPLHLPSFLISIVISFLFLWLGIWYFRKTEKSFADNI